MNEGFLPASLELLDRLGPGGSGGDHAVPPADTVELRDVGRGEQSGYARLPELIARLNALSTGATYSANGLALAYNITDASRVGHFDRVLMSFIDADAVIPLRFTNRQGLLGSHATGFHDQVDIDSWTTGYVDIDDLLASDDLGLQLVMVHFITERAATRNYARRIGSSTFTLAEFRRVHRRGNRAEERLLRDYFGDPTIRLIADSVNPRLRRLFKNDRRDFIRRLVIRRRGRLRNVGGMRVDVKRRDGTVMSAAAYRDLLARERAAAHGEERFRTAAVNAALA